MNPLDSGTRSHPITTNLVKLHWLPVRQRVDFKIALLSFKTLSSGHPLYLSEFLQWYTPSRQLRSSTQSLLVVPPTKTILAARSFSVYAPQLWNSLPVELRSSITSSFSLPHFKSCLKTHLFHTAYPDSGLKNAFFLPEPLYSGFVVFNSTLIYGAGETKCQIIIIIII